MMTIIFQYLAI